MIYPPRKRPCRLFFLFYGLLLLGIGGETAGASDREAQRSERSIVAPEWISVRTGLGWGSQSLGFELSEADLSVPDLQISPNTPLHWVVGVGYRRLGIVGRLKLPSTIGDPEDRGVTDYSNLQIQYFGDRIAVDIVLQQHHGMYISNAASFEEEITDPVLPNLDLTTAGVSAMWVTNRSHSLAAAYTLNALPTRSTASAILIGGASVVGIESPGGPARNIPAAAGSVWDDDVYVFTRTITAGVGAAANIVYRRFFVAPLLGLGLGVQYSDFLVGSIRDDVTSLAPTIVARMSAGYNGRKWFWAILGSFDFRNVQTPYLSATQGSQRIEVVLGRRFSGRRWQGTRNINP